MSQDAWPAYIQLLENGELERRTSLACARLTRCEICAWECRVDRSAGKLGICRTAELAQISSYGPHLGEENPLRGWRGSGAIFFTRCNLRCQYCQNAEISQSEAGRAVVSPKSWQPSCWSCKPRAAITSIWYLPATSFHKSWQRCSWQPAGAAPAAGLQHRRLRHRGNSASPGWRGGYLHARHEIFQRRHCTPLFKGSALPRSQPGSRARNAPPGGRPAGGSTGLAIRGLLVRHLVLPNGLAGTAEIVHFLAEEISPNTYLNIMDQYYPAFKASQFPKLNRRVTIKEYQAAVQMARAAGLQRLDRQ